MSLTRVQFQNLNQLQGKLGPVFLLYAQEKKETGFGRYKAFSLPQIGVAREVVKQIKVHLHDLLNLEGIRIYSQGILLVVKDKEHRL